jgi:hypothetical protein
MRARYYQFAPTGEPINKITVRKPALAGHGVYGLAFFSYGSALVM